DQQLLAVGNADIGRLERRRKRLCTTIGATLQVEPIRGFAFREGVGKLVAVALLALGDGVTAGPALGAPRASDFDDGAHAPHDRRWQLDVPNEVQLRAE